MQTAALPSHDDFIAQGHTPMMAQYLSVRAAHPDCLLFYRMGDFFELFFEDAEKASAVLDIALTRRGKTQGDEIPMCGVPVHSYESYLARLIRAGYKVALCDQVETPEEAKKRGGAKALVRREVIRIVTPGTLTEDTLLPARTHNYLAALGQAGGTLGVAYLDLSTGAFVTEPLTPAQLGAALARIVPGELLVSQRLAEDAALDPLLAPLGRRLTVQPGSLFDPENARARLASAFGVTTLDGFGAFTLAEIAAAGSLLDYAERTQKGRIDHLSPPRRLSADDLLEIDAATRRNLELTETLSGTREGSLLQAIDRTLTAGGGRLLFSRLSAPSRDLSILNARLDEIGAFIASPALLSSVRTALKSVPDLERALARIALRRGAPRDLALIRDGLCAFSALSALLCSVSALPPALFPLREAALQTPDLQALAGTLSAALSDDIPALLQDGGVIRTGYSAELDHVRSLRDDGRKVIAGLQQTYAQESGVETLKVAHNNILGYYLEVSAKRAEALFAKPELFIHRQTMASAVRFTTLELTRLEQELSSAAGKALAIETEIFSGLQTQVLDVRADLMRLSEAGAQLDVAAGLADLALTQNYCRPVLTDEDDLAIVQGRHPVVEPILTRQGAPFIANDADLSPARRLWLLTGPNMAGKSTFLRQNALIVLLAQIGSFVPAGAATIGLVDRLFSRVGAADDLARGRSTFMVEMVETAAILNQATERSFVILDEIGRGTATYDGLSIAWACVEYLHNIVRCRGLFATHYHELTTLSGSLSHLHCATMSVREWKGEIIFLHTVQDGAADRSYGLHVAQLAGLPRAVTDRARDVLTLLESKADAGPLTRLSEDLPLFSAAPPVVPAPRTPPSAVEAMLRDVDPDALSPREALEWVYKLKAAET